MATTKALVVQKLADELNDLPGEISKARRVLRRFGLGAASVGLGAFCLEPVSGLLLMAPSIYAALFPTGPTKSLLKKITHSIELAKANLEASNHLDRTAIRPKTRL